MRRMTKLAPLALALPLALPFAGAGTAWADGTANANLSPVPLNGSQGSGMAMVTVTGTSIEFTLEASGLADGPHAAHIHFGPDARHECPRADEDAEGDNRISTSDGAAAYGPIAVSLTQSGDTSAESGLAVDRFASGADFQYMRGDVTVAQDVATAIEQGQGVVVVHGVAYDDERADAESDLDPSLPASATDPALCGVLSAAPSGGADTGGGGTAVGQSATQNAALVGMGGVALLAAAGAGTVVARRTRGE
jgi:Cu/Zn superoxide dismutase